MDAALTTKITVLLYQYIGSFVYILGNIGNLFCLIVFCQKSWRKNVCVFYFLICLLFDTIYINSTLLGFVFIYGFDINLSKSNVIICKLFTYFALLFSTLSPTILICASIDRLLISSQNVDTRLYSSRRLAYFLIGITTLCWMIFFSHVLIQFQIKQFPPFFSLCLFNSTGFYAIFVVYSMLVINVVSFFVLIILSALSFQNVHLIRSIPRRQRQPGRAMHKKDVQLLQCLFAKDIIYIICNLFLCAYVIYNAITTFRILKLWEQELDAFLFRVSSLIHHIPSCASFYTYVIISKAFRQHLQRMAWKIIGKTVVANPEEEPNEPVIRQVANGLIVVSSIDT